MKNASVHHFYQGQLALLTDLYQLTMASAYWKMGMTEHQAVFHLFYRRNPFGGGYAVAAGLQAVIEFLSDFRYPDEDLEYLATLKGADDRLLFDADFLHYLSQMKFSCKVDGVPEGEIVFPYEPLIRVQGPLIQAQLLETPLLTLVNFPTLIATKAARICQAAKGEPVLEFGLRRSQGVDGGVTAARSAYIGGCVGSSNVLAGKLFGIPVRGTHAHSWVMVFDSELESFDAYAKAMPHNCIFLVDTFDTLEGVRNAIEIGKKLKAQGNQLLGIRLDSGDLAYLSIQARKLLDESGFQDTAIVASNELDEYIIRDLKRQKATIGVWGVGTKLATGGPQAALDGVYKVSAVKAPGQEWQYKLKLSEQMTKISNPGIHQVRRYYEGEMPVGDVIFDEGTDLSSGCVVVDPFDPTRHKKLEATGAERDLLIPIFRDGQLSYASPGLEATRKRCMDTLKCFHEGVRRFVYPHQYVVGLEKSLYEKKIQMVEAIRHQ